MSCVNSTCCDCNGCEQPISSSGPAVDVANCATVGTCDTINALVTKGGNAIFATKQKQQQLAVRAQTQIAVSQIHAITVVAIAVIVIVLFSWIGKARMRG